VEADDDCDPGDVRLERCAAAIRRIRLLYDAYIATKSGRTGASEQIRSFP
jgi:hypothetical protein